MKQSVRDRERELPSDGSSYRTAQPGRKDGRGETTVWRFKGKERKTRKRRNTLSAPASLYLAIGRIGLPDFIFLL